MQPPLTDAAAHSGRPLNTHGHGDRGGLAAGTRPWKAGHAPGIHPQPLDGLGLQQPGHRSRTERNHTSSSTDERQLPFTGDSH